MTKPGENTPYDKYKETQIKTANQGKLIIMLYDGAIKFLTQAKESLAKKDVEESHNKIVRAQDIIMELLLSLNMQAGQIAHKLYNLYLYMNKKLMEANVYKKVEPVDEVLKMLLDLKEVWSDVSDQPSLGDETSLEKSISVNIST